MGKFGAKIQKQSSLVNRKALKIIGKRQLSTVNNLLTRIFSYLCGKYVMATREREIYKVTLVGTVVNAVLIVLKSLAGIFGRSSAMLADAVHSLSDFVTDIVVIAFVRIAGKPSDKGHGYGHGKYETLATLIIGVFLALAGLGLMVAGIEKIVRSIGGEQLPQPTVFALVIALVSIVSKEWLYRYTVVKGRRLDSPAVIANAWHHRSDAISSVGTLIGVGGAIFLGTRWRILDPIAAVVVSVFIIKSGYDIIRPCLSELLEASLSEEEEHEISGIIDSIPGIEGVHRLRSRRVGNAVAIDAHALMDGSQTLMEAHEKASEAERALRARFGTGSIINIHMEPADRKRSPIR